MLPRLLQKACKTSPQLWSSSRLSILKARYCFPIRRVRPRLHRWRRNLLTGETQRALVARHRHSGKRLQVCCAHSGRTHLMESQTCRVRRFPVSECTNAIFIFPRLLSILHETAIQFKKASHKLQHCSHGAVSPCSESPQPRSASTQQGATPMKLSSIPVMPHLKALL